jgi:ATP-dependent DNA helicase RecG
MMLDKVQKKKELNDDELVQLKSKKLIEGKKPNFIISENIAVSTKQMANYIKLRGEDNAYYKKIVYELICKNKTGTDKKEIRELLSNKLPEVISDKQKEHKMSYILRRLKEEGKIENNGSDATPNWIPRYS